MLNINPSNRDASQGIPKYSESLCLNLDGLPTMRQRLFHSQLQGEPMNPDDEKILKMTKEILVKFIELGRVSTTNFDENFRRVFWAIKNTAVSARLPDLEAESPPPAEETE